MGTHAHNSLIALGNLRAAAHAACRALATAQNGALGLLCDGLSRELAASRRIESVGADTEETIAALTRLCETSSEVASACQSEPVSGDALRVVRSFEAALAVARAVLRAAPTSGVHRSTLPPSDLARRAG